MKKENQKPNTRRAKRSRVEKRVILRRIDCKRIDEMFACGLQLSNLCYNYKQQKECSEDYNKIFDERVTSWDKISHDTKFRKLLKKIVAASI